MYVEGGGTGERGEKKGGEGGRARGRYRDTHTDTDRVLGREKWPVSHFS